MAMTLFMRCENLMEEEAGSVASSSSTPLPAQDEEMALRIQQGIGLMLRARREAAQALSRVVERRQGATVSEGSSLHIAY